MKRIDLWLMLVLFTAVILNAAAAALDITKITGIPGIKKIPRDPSKGASGDLNFTNAKGNVIFMAQFSSYTYYAKFKQMKEMYGSVRKIEGTQIEVAKLIASRL